MSGAEPLSATGGEEGVLVLHGFTGNPFEMRPLAERLAADGLSVELPRLPGHGTSLDDLVPLGFGDWSAAAEGALVDLGARCRAVAVVGLSMGGTLACWLAERHPEIVGLVLVNPLVEPPGAELRDAVTGLLDTGEVMPGIGDDVADPSVTAKPSYPGTPLRALLSLFDAVESVSADLGSIECPVLLFTSRQDHVVPTSNSDLLADRVAGPVERVWLDASYHVATIDYDRDEIERRTVAFVAQLFAGAVR